MRLFNGITWIIDNFGVYLNFYSNRRIVGRQRSAEILVCAVPVMTLRQSHRFRSNGCNPPIGRRPHFLPHWPYDYIGWGVLESLFSVAAYSPHVEDSGRGAVYL
jgi:hypothetical protein